ADVVEDPHRGRMEHRRAEDDVGERILRVLTRRPPAREERLQRLGRELDNALAIDPARPAALEILVARREHAQLHRGSVCTTTSAISGCSRRMSSSILLASAWAAASVSEPSRSVR